MRSIYHECDLLIAETLAEGVLEDAEPATIAAALSAFVFEPKKAKKTGPHRHTPTAKKRVRNDRLGDQRRSDINGRIGAIMGIAAYIQQVEDNHHVRHAKELDGGFASTIAAWVRGAPLSTVLEIAEADTGQFSAGDFVRNAKQVADLCEQVSRLSSGSLTAAANEARDGVLRSVVAGASTVHPRKDTGF